MPPEFLDHRQDFGFLNLAKQPGQTFMATVLNIPAALAGAVPERWNLPSRKNLQITSQEALECDFVKIIAQALTVGGNKASRAMIPLSERPVLPKGNCMLAQEEISDRAIEECADGEIFCRVPPGFPDQNAARAIVVNMEAVLARDGFTGLEDLRLDIRIARIDLDTNFIFREGAHIAAEIILGRNKKCAGGNDRFALYADIERGLTKTQCVADQIAEVVKIIGTQDSQGLVALPSACTLLTSFCTLCVGEIVAAGDAAEIRGRSFATVSSVMRSTRPAGS